MGVTVGKPMGNVAGEPFISMAMANAARPPMHDLPILNLRFVPNYAKIDGMAERERVLLCPYCVNNGDEEECWKCLVNQK